MAAELDDGLAADVMAAHLIADAGRQRQRFEFGAAAVTAARAVSEFPLSAGAHVALGCALLSAHRLDEALESFRAGDRLAAGREDALAWQIAALSRQRNFEEAEQLGRTACTERFPAGVLVRISLGRVYLDSSRPAEAVPLLAEAALGPDELRAVEYYAEALWSVRRWAECEQVIEDAIEVPPTGDDLPRAEYERHVKPAQYVMPG